MSGEIFPASKMRLMTKVVHIKFHFLTHSPAGIMSLTVFLEALSSAAIFVTMTSYQSEKFYQHELLIMLICILCG